MQIPALQRGRGAARDASPLGARRGTSSRLTRAAAGNDVATGLKWQLFTDSVVLMPEPTKESWLLEGELRPMVHYVPVKRDWSDLEERLAWCESHPSAAKNISRRATAHVRRVLGGTSQSERRVVTSVLHGYRQALAASYEGRQ